MSKPRIGMTTGLETGDEAAPIRPGRRHLYLDLDYCGAVREAGGVAVALPPAAEDDLDRVLDGLDGLLVPGGGDLSPETAGWSSDSLDSVNRDREAFELPLIKAALEHGLPFLGICYGAQVLNFIEGGTLIQDIEAGGSGGVDHGDPKRKRRVTHRIEVPAGSPVARWYEGREPVVLSCHHQAVDRVAPGYEAAALAPDGLVEAIVSVARAWAVGVQWHPESMASAGCGASRRLFEDFVAACGRPRRGKQA